MLVSVLSLAFAGDPRSISDEVVIYGDEFARWNHTRWLLQSELLLPLGMDFSSDENKAFRSFGFQIRAVILCDKDVQLAKHRWEVLCAVEDFGVLATSENRWKTEADRALADEVLRAVDERITGAKVQIQVDDEGGITNFDIEGIDADNQRERRIQETTRQMMSRVMSGFHLRIPDQGQRTGQWVEYNSELVDLPTLAAARGSSQMLHQVSPMKDLQIVQTIGEGAVTVNLPRDSRDPFHSDLAGLGAGSANTSAPSGGLGGPSRGAPTRVSTAPAYAEKESTIEATFRVEVSGVAVFEKATGIMTERVWTSTGQATASGPWGMGKYRNVGRIRLLAPGDEVDVGPSRQVSWPGQTLEGLPPWVSVEVMPGDDAAPLPPG